MELSSASRKDNCLVHVVFMYHYFNTQPHLTRMDVKHADKWAEAKSAGQYHLVADSQFGVITLLD